MPTEIDLLRSLDPEPPTPSTVDITRAIAAGRKRRMRRGAGYAGVAAVTTLVVAGVAVAVGQHGTGSFSIVQLLGGIASGAAQFGVPGIV